MADILKTEQTLLTGSIPAITGIDDPSKARMVLYQAGRPVHAPMDQVGLAVADDTYSLDESQQLLRRNLIVNPTMAVSQENGNTAGTTTGYHAADQWFTGFVTSAGALSSQRVASTTPSKSVYRYRLSVTTADASLAAGEYLLIQQYIEGARLQGLGWGASGAKQVILRFGIKAPSGTYSVAFRNGAADRSYVQNFTISVADTDTEVTLTFPGDTSGTWPVDTSRGSSVAFCFACGSTFQTTAGAWAAGSYLGTSSNSNGLTPNTNVFEIFDVGLYCDPDATGIIPDFQANSFGFDLGECLRYYYRSDSCGPTLGYFYAASGATLYYAGAIAFPVPMRTAPSVTTITAPTYVNCSAQSWAYLDTYTAAARVTSTAAGQYRAWDGDYGFNARM